MPSWMRITCAVLAVIGLIALQQVLTHRSVIEIEKTTSTPSFTEKCHSIWEAGEGPFPGQDDSYVAYEFSTGDDNAEGEVRNGQEIGVSVACAERRETVLSWALLVGMATTLLAAGALFGRRQQRQQTA